MSVSGLGAAEQERRRLKRTLVRIAAIEVDWKQGLTSDAAAMAAISEALEESKR